MKQAQADTVQSSPNLINQLGLTEIMFIRIADEKATPLAIKSIMMAFRYSSTAKIPGIDNSVGTIESGKDATLIVSDGDILDMRSSKVTYAFIRGKQIDLDNKQKQLYRRFMAKYGLTPVE